MTDIDYFIRKFEAIPEKNWTKDEYGYGERQLCCGTYI